MNAIIESTLIFAVIIEQFAKNTFALTISKNTKNVINFFVKNVKVM